MSLEKKGTVIVTPAIRVTDLPALPGDVTDSSRMGKWWDDFRQVLARLIQAKSESQSKEQVVVQTEVTAETPQPEAESKPVDWDDIANKPEKFPPLDHTHKTPWLQVEDPLCLSEVDPDTNLATLGFYEQKAATFLAGPLSGPVAKPVFRPLYTGDDTNLDGSGAGSTPGDPGTIDDLNGGTVQAAPTGSLITQTKGATARISGCSPLDGVETFRRWRTQTASGTLHKYGWVGNYVCAYDPSGHNSYALSGSCQWTASDDVTVTNTMQYIDESSVVHALNYGVIPLPGSPFQSDAGTETTSPTVRQYVANGECISENGTPASSHRSTGSEAYTLSNEDTEDNAYTRAITEQSADWSSSLSSAIYTARAQLNFDRRALRYGHGKLVRVGGTDEAPVMELQADGGYTPWGVYEVTVALRRRPVDSAGATTGDGSYSDWETRTHLIMADIDGKAMLAWQEVDAPRGYEVIVGSHTIAPFI